MNQANQRYGEMGIVRNLPIPDLTELRRFPQAGACEPHVHLCDELAMADRLCTTALHEFLTSVTQGFSAYRDIAATAARIYADGATDSVERIRSSCAQQASGLPTVSPALTDPAPEE